MSIKQGDVVCHKSGGPAMTVEHVGTRPSHISTAPRSPLGLDSGSAIREEFEGNERTVWCVWFVERAGGWDGPYRKAFDVDALKITQPGDRTTALFNHVMELSKKHGWALSFDMTNQWIVEQDA